MLSCGRKIMTIEVLRDDIFPGEYESALLSFISIAFKYDYPDLGTAKFRFVGSLNEEVIAHAALSERLIEINGHRYNVLLLGQVCTLMSMRNKGVGRAILQFIKKYEFDKKYDLIILNCGNEIEGFYRKNGFSKISTSAGYLRKGKVEVDSDPVYCLTVNNHIKINDLHTETIFLGEDF